MNGSLAKTASFMRQCNALSTVLGSLQETPMEEKIHTRHPDKNKRGVNISRTKYETIRDAMVDILKAKPELTFTNLTQEIEKRLKGRFEGSLPWYAETVKLDLEARKVIERALVGGREVYRLK